MNVLVIGRSGQLARSLAEAAGGGIAVTLAGRTELDLGDVASISALIARLRPQIVVNAAAYTQVDRAETDEAAAQRINADGAGHVARACAANDIPIIHISTDYVFDGRKPTPYVETDPTAPLNAYGRSKLEGERRVVEANARHLIFRTSWVHSPWGQNFVRTMLQLATKRTALTVVDDQRGSPTYAPHLAEAILSLARRALADQCGTYWGIYHAAGQGSTTWFDFAREVFRQAASHGLPTASVSPIASADYPTAAQRPLNSQLDCGAMQSAFAVTLPNWQSGVRDCMARIAADRASRAATTGSGDRSDSA